MKTQKKKEDDREEANQSAMRSSAMSKSIDHDDGDCDLWSPEEFAEALKTRIGRPFVFGQIEFSGLDQPKEFDSVKAKNSVTKFLEKKTLLAEPGNNICIHGFRVTIKDRTFKRSTSLAKHARFL